MISLLSKLKVCDNSGVKSVKCFKVYKTYFGKIGSLVHVSIRETKNKNKYVKGDVAKGIIVRSKKTISRSTGNFLRFSSNDVILIDIKYDLVGTRIFGPLPLELRRKNYVKLLSLASKLI